MYSIASMPEQEAKQGFYSDVNIFAMTSVHFTETS